MWFVVVVFLYTLPDRTLEMKNTYREPYTYEQCALHALAWKLTMVPAELVLDDGTVPEVKTSCEQKL